MDIFYTLSEIGWGKVICTAIIFALIVLSFVKGSNNSGNNSSGGQNSSAPSNNSGGTTGPTSTN